jgi:hypothetical protein
VTPAGGTFFNGAPSAKTVSPVAMGSAATKDRIDHVVLPGHLQRLKSIRLRTPRPASVSLAISMPSLIALLFVAAVVYPSLSFLSFGLLLGVGDDLNNLTIPST